MARNDDGYGVAAVRKTDRAGCFRAADAVGQLAVADGLPVWNFAEVAPNEELKLRTLKDERQIELSSLSFKVGLKLADHLFERSCILYPIASRGLGPAAGCEVNQTQTGRIPREQKRPDGTFHCGVRESTHFIFFHCAAFPLEVAVAYGL